MEAVFQNATPESVGISSKDIRALIKRLKDEGHYMHSLLIIKEGKLITEGYYAPFTKDTKHRMYSVSKSFVSGAIGCLYDEGRLKLTDRVCTYFPEFPEADLHPYVREATIRDLLMMSSPHVTTYSMTPGDPNFANWVESFFTAKPKRPAGTVFCYDTSATYVLDALVERVTGKTFLAYLQDKMLRELGCSEDMWCVQAPEGYAWGGSGVLCTPLDLAKYAFIFLRGGNVNGKQFISEEYIKAATSKQIQNNSFGYNRLFENLGYGYQVWRMPENGFAFLGMGGQFAYAVPDKDLLIVSTADEQGRGEGTDQILKAYVEEIVQKVSAAPLPENPADYEALQVELSELALTIPAGEQSSGWTEKVQDVIYQLDENPMGWKWMKLSFAGAEGTLTYENTRGVKEISFGLCSYKEGRFPESHYSGYRIGTPKGEGYKCAAAGMWTGENQFHLRVNIVDDYIGNLGLTFGFRDIFVGITAAKAAEAFLHDYFGLAGGRAV